jgi:hypothetical protein
MIPTPSVSHVAISAYGTWQPNPYNPSIGTKHIKNPEDFLPMCKHLDRFPVPDDDERINKFKDREDGYYVFFQHVRKSGGTAFCSLAQKSMKKEYTNPNYCKSVSTL